MKQNCVVNEKAHCSPQTPISVRLLGIFLLLLCLQVQAPVFAQTVTLNEQKSSLEKVFKQIEKQVGYSFVYDRLQLQNSQPVSIQVKDMPLKKALDMCLSNQQLAYTINQTTIFIRKKSNLSEIGGVIQSDTLINVTGKVLTEKGEPASGVAISVSGSNKMTVSNDRGEFQLAQVPPDATLQFTSVNMEKREIAINGSSNIRVTLTLSVTNLTDVAIVNTGYQAISKERFVGSYSKLDSAAYNRRTGVNILNRLDGTIPGVVFNSKGSRAPIQIRGISTIGTRINGSLTAFDPLIILDNFPFDGDINTINQNDVLDITVSKDAAALSIWGTRAANGVIIITTKKGRYNQAARITISSNITINSKPNLHSFKALNSSDYIDVETSLFNNGYYDNTLSYPQYYPVSPVVMLLDKQRRGLLTATEVQDQINSYRLTDVRDDYDKYYFKRAVSQQHYVNLSGGSNTYSYNFSFGFNNNVPAIQGAKTNRQFTINAANTFRPVKNLELELGIYLAKDKQYDYSSVTYPFNAGQGGALAPYIHLADAQGNHLAVARDYNTDYADSAGHGLLLNWRYRPLDEIGLADNPISSQFAKINLGISYRFTDWLKADLRYQYLEQSSEGRNLQSQQTYYTRNLINLYTNLSETDPHFRYPIAQGGILDINNNKITSQNARAQININKSWQNQHQLTTIIAGDISESKGTSTSARFYGYNPTIGTYASGIDFYTFFPWFGDLGFANIPENATTSFAPTSRIVSLLGNTSYTYRNKYTVYISGRRDGTNVFGVNTNSKWKPLWSTGISWDILKESFINVSWINNLRLRSSYGYTGNVDNSNTGKPTMGYTGTVPYTNLNEATIGKAPNPDLRWETVKTYNLGADFGLFRNRLSGSFDIYSKQSSDLLANIPIDPTSGVTTAIINAANLSGRGIELQLRSVNTKGAFIWETSIAMAYNKTTVKKYYNADLKVTSFNQYNINPVEGQIAWGVYAYRWAGLNKTTGDPQGYFQGQVSTAYNSILNDTIKNQIFVGSAIPLYSGFLLNSFNWKSFSLSANITYRFKYFFRKPALSYSALYSGTNNTDEYLRRWQKPGDEASTNVPSSIYPADGNRDLFYQYSEINVLKGDNIRLQDVRLSYTLPVIKALKGAVKSAQFFIYANNLNLILWRANKAGYDPDFTGGATSFNYLPTKTWTLGINVSL